MLMSLYIFGPKLPSNELKVLWENSVHAVNEYLGEEFSLKALYMLTIYDFPAYGNSSGCTAKGDHACLACVEDEEGTICLKHGKKMVYITYRLLLPLRHPYRRQMRRLTSCILNLPHSYVTPTCHHYRLRFF